jgi:citronellyl-CoA synthetase
VENIMNEFDNIAETVAYGVEIPNTNGRAGMAAVIATDPGRPIEFGKLHAFLKNAMPPYAIPVFIRVRTSMATTGTFKYKKTDLKKEGFDLKQVRDPLYVLLPGGNAYEALTPEIYGRIMDGTYKY